MIFKDDTDEVGQNRLVNLCADFDEDVFEDNEVEEDNEKEETHQIQGEESSQAGPAAKAKVVRRLSFSSSSGENDAKKLKTSGESGRESKKATRGLKETKKAT